MITLLEKVKKIDWFIVVILCLFMFTSIMLVYSATVDNSNYPRPILLKNIYLYIFGFFCFFITTLIDFRIFMKFAIYLYSFGVILLVAVLLFGKTQFGSTGWFTIPFIRLDFQPAELMKLVLIITISAFLARREGASLAIVRDVIPISLLGILAFLLVLSENDLGNAIIYFVILLGMLWIGNIKFKYVLIGTMIIITCLTALYYSYTANHNAIYNYLNVHHHGQLHWMGRIDTLIDPSLAKNGQSYQVDNSVRAIGSGQLTGDGYLKGFSIHKGIIPVAYSDAIFVVVGEEFGFIGSAILLLFYFLLIYRMILISIQTLDLSGSYLIVGIVSMYVFQIFENIGMLIRIMPLTGITLPFISYGGTSLFINMLSLGIVMSVRVHQEKLPLFQQA